jgi:hypothetical protein
MAPSSAQLPDPLEVFPDKLIVLYTNPKTSPILTETYKLSHIDYETAIVSVSTVRSYYSS